MIAGIRLWIRGTGHVSKAEHRSEASPPHQRPRGRDRPPWNLRCRPAGRQVCVV